MTNEFIFQLLMVVMAAAATYGGIRADIKQIHEKIEDVKGIGIRAHRRLDQHLGLESKDHEHL